MNSCVYIIDKQNLIVSLSGNWLSFARENQAEESCRPDRVLHEPIWKFIDGEETSYLYQLCLAKIRSQQRPMILPFRCDAPDQRRYLELQMTPLAQEQIEFSSRILRVEVRERVKLLEPDAPRAETFIKMCSMCKKIKIAEKIWLEVEEAVATLGLFGEEPLPRITHGCCPPCYEIAMAEIRACSGGKSSLP